MGGYGVTVEALQSAGSTLRGIGGDLGAIDGSGPLTSAAAALPGSSTATAAGGLAAEVSTAIRGSGAAVTTLGESAEASGRTYDAADDASISRFGGPR